MQDKPQEKVFIYTATQKFLNTYILVINEPILNNLCNVYFITECLVKGEILEMIFKGTSLMTFIIDK